MAKSKYLGIWMDHASANLMEYTNPVTTEVILAETEDQSNDDSTLKGESQKHNREQNRLAAYYKKLGEVIREYEEVILFGPTHAKTELYHKLQASIHFDKIKIGVQEADKMTENQQHAFVKAYFSKSNTETFI